jgi:hypothetical protein
MNQLNSYLMTSRNIAIVLCFLFLAFNAAQAQITPDIKKIWTTVGSDGTVDEKDTAKVFFDHGIVQMGNLMVSHPIRKPRTALPQMMTSAVIRYNITPAEGLFFQVSRGLSVSLRFMDNGGGSRVIAKLIELDWNTGTERTLMTFDSNKFSALDGYQTQTVTNCEHTGREPPFDFETKAYYVEATLATNTMLPGNVAGIQIIKISRYCFF